MAFLLTRLLRGATPGFLCFPASLPFLLTRLLRGATSAIQTQLDARAISTHAPLARRDACRTVGLLLPVHFYSRASCEARRLDCKKCHDEEDFYSRASCEARRASPKKSGSGRSFLLTRLLRGATCSKLGYDMKNKNFYSRASCEARRSAPTLKTISATISTHAPLARRDATVPCGDVSVVDFYSRASCEARLGISVKSP